MILQPLYKKCEHSTFLCWWWSGWQWTCVGPDLKCNTPVAQSTLRTSNDSCAIPLVVWGSGSIAGGHSPACIWAKRHFVDSVVSLSACVSSQPLGHFYGFKNGNVWPWKEFRCRLPPSHPPPVRVNANCAATGGAIQCVTFPEAAASRCSRYFP